MGEPPRFEKVRSLAIRDEKGRFVQRPSKPVSAPVIADAATVIPPAAADQQDGAQARVLRLYQLHLDASLAWWNAALSLSPSADLIEAQKAGLRQAWNASLGRWESLVPQTARPRGKPDP